MRTEPPKQLIPSSAIEEIAALVDLKSALTDVAATWDPKYTGPIDSKAGSVREFLGLSDPKETEFRQFLSTLVDLAYAKSGKTIGPREMAILQRRLPEIFKADKTFAGRMVGLNKLLDQAVGSKIGLYQSGGYYVPPDLRAEAGLPDPIEAINPTNGVEIISYDGGKTWKRKQ